MNELGHAGHLLVELLTYRHTYRKTKHHHFLVFVINCEIEIVLEASGLADPLFMYMPRVEHLCFFGLVVWFWGMCVFVLPGRYRTLGPPGSDLSGFGDLFVFSFLGFVLRLGR